MADGVVRTGRDRGFTLVELIVAIVLIGIVTTAIAFAAMVMLRSTPGNNERIEHSAALRSLLTWLGRDLASVEAVALDATSGLATDEASCTPPETVLLTLRWRFQGVTHKVDYAAVDGRLIRVACGTPDAGSVVLHGTYSSASFRLSPAPELDVFFEGDVIVGCDGLAQVDADCDGGTPVTARVEVELSPSSGVTP